jgi:hypothetical protein
MRFAEVVDAGPNELANHIVVVAHAEPVVDLVAGLGAEKQPVREAFVLGRVGALPVDAVDVVVAHEIELVHETVA